MNVLQSKKNREHNEGEIIRTAGPKKRFLALSIAMQRFTETKQDWLITRQIERFLKEGFVSLGRTVNSNQEKKIAYKANFLTSCSQWSVDKWNEVFFLRMTNDLQNF